MRETKKMNTKNVLINILIYKLVEYISMSYVCIWIYYYTVYHVIYQIKKYIWLMSHIIDHRCIYLDTDTDVFVFIKYICRYSGSIQVCCKKQFLKWKVNPTKQQVRYQ